MIPAWMTNDRGQNPNKRQEKPSLPNCLNAISDSRIQSSMAQFESHDLLETVTKFPL